MCMDRGPPRLGERIDAEGYQKFSADAQADDTNAIFDDEDSIDLTQWGIVTSPGQSHTERVACEGAGKIAGWIDWNNNGVFDDTEKSDEVACDNAANSATLTWTVPADVTNTKRSVDGEPGSRPDSYMRVRITNDNNGDGQRPVGVTSTGEVEDYKVSIRVPTLQLTKDVDNTYASDEVPGLGADQWTVTGTGANDTISGAGTTGDPQADLDAALSKLPDARMRKRVRHVVSENDRTCAALDLARKGLLAEIPPLLNESHASMREDYEITVPTVDLAVETALAHGALGARMTGGGFGGCIIAWCPTGQAEHIGSAIHDAFEKAGLQKPSWFTAAPSGGAGRLS